MNSLIAGDLKGNKTPMKLLFNSVLEQQLYNLEHSQLATRKEEEKKQDLSLFHRRQTKAYREQGARLASYGYWEKSQELNLSVDPLLTPRFSGP